MDITKKISHRLFLWLFLWFFVLGLVFVLFGYWEMSAIEKIVQEKQSFDVMRQVLRDLSLLFCQVLAAGLVVIGLLLWLTLRSSMKRALRDLEGAALPELDQKKQKEVRLVPKPTPAEKKSGANYDQRRALHLLSLLQREGRLVDFLEEDLQSFDDAQIGAAVRSIQEICKKSLGEYFALEAVIDQNEGEVVTISAGFDTSAIKLTGNVSGAPPFKGVLQHRGWRATRFDLPTLAGSQDPGIIAPAEVEIE